jgi:hypothetical protein
VTSREVRVTIDRVKAFEFDGGTVSEFINRVRALLFERDLADHVKLRSEGSELVVEFRWMGSSELRYRISGGPVGFRAELDGERVSPFHLPFRSQFEDRFEKVVDAVGAKVV